MTTYRVPKTGNFSMVQNELDEDPRISWEAKGVQHYLLGKPDDWVTRVYDLLRHGPAGKAKLRRIEKELERYGYLRRVKFRLPNGRFAWRTDIYESPITPPPLDRPRRTRRLPAQPQSPVPDPG